MKKRMLVPWMAIWLLVAACAEPDVGSGHASTTLPPNVDGAVVVDSTEILYREGSPVEAHLAVRGSLPTPCHSIRWVAEDVGGVIDVRLWSEVNPGRACVQVLAPFEIVLTLGSFESAGSPVLLNGEEVGRLAIEPDPVPGDDVALVGAGWSFGMCGGYCNADLAIEAESLVLTGTSRITNEPLYVNRGGLTAAGRERIDRAVGMLGGVGLDPVYGCPDCADGGAAYLILERQGLSSRHDMDFARPPDVLAELYGLAVGLIGALETCEPNALVTVAYDCEPWQGL